MEWRLGALCTEGAITLEGGGDGVVTVVGWQPRRRIVVRYECGTTVPEALPQIIHPAKRFIHSSHVTLAG